MNATDLLTRLKCNDDEAFRQLLLAYGKGIYHRLYARSGNREAAKQALKTAFTEFYAALSRVDSSDPLEAMLYTRAEKAQDELLCHSHERVFNEVLNSAPLPEPGARPAAPPPAPHPTLPPLPKKESVGPPPSGPEPFFQAKADAPDPWALPGASAPLPEAEPHPRRRCSPGTVAAIVFLSLGVAAALWVIAGLLMSFGLLPELDLGYAWFNANVIPWF